jgi:biopolymer transport protein ExbB
MKTLLLQISTAATDTAAVAAAPAASNQELSIIDLILAGGWVMLPIILMSLISIYIIIERYIAIKNASKNPDAFMEAVKAQVIQGDLNGAKALCSRTDTPIARMIEKGIRRIGNPLKDIETAIENVGRLEVSKLEKNISILGIIAGIAPMLGFVGTIIGVIKIFYAISASGDFGIAQISGGLYTKMVTSAAGLIVGIIAHIGYHYLSLLVERLVHKMENNALDFTDLLQDN